MCAADKKASYSSAVIKGSTQNGDIETAATLNRCSSLKASPGGATVPTAHRERSPRRRARRGLTGASGPLEETRPGLEHTAEGKVFPESCCSNFW